MTQEQKELLLKDLCGRLPYGVKAQIYNHWRSEYEYETLTLKNYYELIDTFCVEDIKPYLFPLSSMTKEQQKEANIFDDMDMDILSENLDRNRRNKTNIPTPTFNYTDWLNAHHFDYRGLIPLGLAIDATNKKIY